MGLFFEVLPFNHLDSLKENVCLYKACAYVAKIMRQHTHICEIEHCLPVPAVTFLSQDKILY
jgi:hypothetical protein